MTYKHKVQRVYAMEQMGFGYERMEAEGFYSPVIGITCDYKHPTTFPDTIDVDIYVAEISKLKCRFSYRMSVGDKVACTATSQHCFLDRNGRPVVIEDKFPQFYRALTGMKE